MTLEQSVVLALVRAKILNIPAVLPQGAENCDWSAALTEARQQSVLLMFFEELSLLGERVPKAVIDKCFALSCAVLANNAKIGHVQKNLSSRLSKKGYPMVILKGEAAAAYYDNPQLRMLGDIDFLSADENLDAIKEMLLSDGYTISNEEHICHRTFSRPDAQLELHFEISGMPTGELREKILSFQKDIFETSQVKNIGGGDFPAPSDCHHALILLLHSQHHMLGEGLGLRHLCDWAYFVKNTENMPFWEETLLPFLKEIGLMRFAVALTKMCSLHLGINCPYWALCADDDVCNGLFLEVLEGGNFGRKDALRTTSEKMITARGKKEKNKGKSYYLYENLKASVLEKYPVVKEKKWLFPFYFVFRAARYCWFSLTGKRASLRKSFLQADKRNALYDNLHIFEVENYER